MSELTDAISYVKRMADEARVTHPLRAHAMRLVAEAAENPLSSPAFELVLNLQAASSKESAWVTNELLSSYQRDAKRKSIALMLVRDDIFELIGGQYMPTSHAIVRALYPAVERVDALYEQGDEGDTIA